MIHAPIYDMSDYNISETKYKTNSLNEHYVSWEQCNQHTIPTLFRIVNIIVNPGYIWFLKFETLCASSSYPLTWLKDHTKNRNEIHRAIRGLEKEGLRSFWKHCVNLIFNRTFLLLKGNSWWDSEYCTLLSICPSSRPEQFVSFSSQFPPSPTNRSPQSLRSSFSMEYNFVHVRKYICSIHTVLHCSPMHSFAETGDKIYGTATVTNYKLSMILNRLRALSHCWIIQHCYSFLNKYNEGLI